MIKMMQLYLKEAINCDFSEQKIPLWIAGKYKTPLKMQTKPRLPIEIKKKNQNYKEHTHTKEKLDAQKRKTPSLSPFYTRPHVWKHSANYFGL